MALKYKEAGPSVFSNGSMCHMPPDNAFNMWRGVEDKNLPWTGVIFGLTISAAWYWCSDQVMMQMCKMEDAKITCAK